MCVQQSSWREKSLSWGMWKPRHQWKLVASARFRSSQLIVRTCGEAGHPWDQGSVHTRRSFFIARPGTLACDPIDGRIRVIGLLPSLVAESWCFERGLLGRVPLCSDGLWESSGVGMHLTPLPQRESARRGLPA